MLLNPEVGDFTWPGAKLLILLMVGEPDGGHFSNKCEFLHIILLFPHFSAGRMGGPWGLDLAHGMSVAHLWLNQ